MSLISMLYTLLIKPLELFFEFIYVMAERLLVHPGLAIIMLSITINLLVLPLYRRADEMQEEERDIEKALKRGVDHIKQSFTGDERMMMLQTYYRQNHYKPTDTLKSSVSLLLQVPFFIAAYHFLSNLDELTNVSFGPIFNLGAQDKTLVIGGFAINLLPILMTGINLISSAIYTRDFPVKTKIQLYAMAIIFLIFLYNSPAGLVLYWTLNNFFSLVKTILFKLKRKDWYPLVLIACVGILVFYYNYRYYYGNVWGMLGLNVLGIVLFLPLGLVALKDWNLRKGKEQPAPKAVIWASEMLGRACEKADAKLFHYSGLLLSVLIGGLIPSAVIASSAQEFIDVTNYQSPLWYVLYAFLVACGLFLIWMYVFYWLAGKKAKTIIGMLLFLGCGIGIIDYMFFGTNLGLLSATLVYDDGLNFTILQQALNGIVLVACIGGCIFLIRKFRKVVYPVMLAGIIVLSIMTFVNVHKINVSANQVKAQVTDAEDSDEIPQFTLSTTGKNVVVIMLDKAIGPLVPYLLNEDEELKEQFDGFTYYANTISFGGCTNMGSPSLYGGYEYTPYELNLRSTESLAEKQNEALKVMPVLFDENDYEVTVCDPTYAGYQWIPDLSIYDDYPDISTYITEGAFSEESEIDTVPSVRRKFFCFALMKTVPVCLQNLLYHGGDYNQADSNIYESTAQSEFSNLTATGIKTSFMKAYLVLKNMATMTQVEESDQNTFLMMSNDTTHEPALLQEPEYEPTYNVNNTEYEEEHSDRYTIDGRTVLMEEREDYTYYQIDMAALQALGDWFDYLREEGVYDNTRIILVADHGNNLGQFEELIIDGDEQIDVEHYAPLLMVKDFDSTGFTTSDEFMTNADVPTLATDDLIENPVNPFTGKAINSDEKTAHDQYVIMLNEWNTEIENGNQFSPSAWCSVHDNIWDSDNWTYIPLEDADELNNR